MIKLLKSSLSIFLAIAIVFSSAYVGLSEVDWFIVFGVKTHAASESGLTFALNDDGESYSVTDCNESVIGELVIPDTYSGKPVTSIGDHSFRSCVNLNGITLPRTIQTIGVYAFYGCTSLKTIDIPDSITIIGDSAFSDCTSLEYVKLGNRVKTIESYAFYNCKKLVSIVIPDGAKQIGINTFYGCTNLETIVIPDSVLYIGGSSFYDTAYYNDSTNWEGDMLYIGNHLIKAKTSFSGDCIVKNGTKTIANSVFYDCTGLTSIIIPEGVISIGAVVFSGCTRLSLITIPDSVTSIGPLGLEDTAYYNDSSNWDGDVLYIGKHLICAKSSLSGCYSIKTNTKTIAYCAFYYCVNLTSITIPYGITTIFDNTFEGCEKLAFVKFPNSITNIGDSAFYNCKRLESIRIPSSVTNIGSLAFGYKLFVTNHDAYDVPIEGFTIYGYKGSTAEQYAQENNFIFVYDEHMHSPSYWFTDKEPTVYKAGSKHKECTECGEVLKTATIPQLKCAKPVLKKVYNANDYVKVTWGTVKGADMYRVYRMVSGGEYEYIGSTSKTYFNDKEAGAGKTCRYRIRAKNEAGYSDYSVSMAIKHIDEPNLIATENTSSGVKITWGNKVTGAQKYNVYRRVSGGEYKYIGSTSDTYYIDETVKSGTKYHYAIRGKRDDSVSSQSESLSKYYLDTPTLNKPSSTTRGIGIKWSQVEGAEGYMVYRRTTDDNYIIVSNEKGESNTAFRDTTTKKGRIYYYRVKAYKSKTYSGNSVTKSVRDEH